MSEKKMKGKDFFYAYSWHLDTKETEKTIIRVYGFDEHNKNTCIIIEDFTPYCYIELPENVDWDTSKALLIDNKINLLTKEQKPLSMQLNFKYKLYYANMTVNKKELERKLYPFLFCSFACKDDMMALSSRIRRPMIIPSIGTMNLKMHEHNATPILQLISLRKLPASGWIQFTGNRIHKDDQITFCHKEYKVKWKNLEEKLNYNVAPKPYVMAYDLEAYSSVGKSSMPKASRPADKIFQISCVFTRLGKKYKDENPHESFLLTLGETDDTLPKDITPLFFKTESDLLLGFTELITKKQPNVCVGHNIFGFDIPYMIDRAKNLMCIYDFDKQGMLKNQHSDIKKIAWSSSANKNQQFEFLDTEGRLFIDTLPIIRRDHRLSEYTLKTLALHFLKDTSKDPLDAEGIFRCYDMGMKGGKKGRAALSLVGKYCVKDSIVALKLFETLRMWISLCQLSYVTSLPMFGIFTQGQQVRVFSQVYRKATHENIVVQKDVYVVKDDDYYTGATVFPPIPGVYDKVMPFDFSSLYPTTIIANNLCWSTLVIDDSIPDEYCNIMEWQDCVGCAHDPKMVRQKEINEIIKAKEVELKELRRKRDLKENKERKEEYKTKISDFIKKMKPLRDERSELKKSKPKHIICSKRRYRWLKKPMGILPSILIYFLEARDKTKKEMEACKEKLKTLKEDDPEYEEISVLIEVLDMRQLALKISANSAYGLSGARKGYLTCMPVAMCTTYMGRCSIEKAAKEITGKHKGVLIYGDTDSNYVSFPHLKTPQECWDYAVKVSKEVTKLFPPPMALAFEKKNYWRYLILTKKRYMSLECDREGNFKKDKKGNQEISKKGVLLQRRDNCMFIRHVYGEVIMMIFNKMKKEDIILFLCDEINKLCSGSYPISDFTVTKSIGSIGKEKDDEEYMIPCEVEEEKKIIYKIGDYKVKLLPTDEKSRLLQLKKKDCDTDPEYYLHCLPAQAQLAEKMKNRGKSVPAGSRIEYVITTNGGHNAKQYEKVEDYEYFKKHRTSLRIDYLYYLKQLTNPMDQVLNIIFGKDEDYQKDFVLHQYQYRLRVRGKVLEKIESLTKPIIVIEKEKKSKK